MNRSAGDATPEASLGFVTSSSPNLVASGITTPRSRHREQSRSYPLRHPIPYHPTRLRSIPVPSLSFIREPRDGTDWMASFDTKSCNSLDDDEMSRLVSIVVEEFGPALARTQFNDVMLGLFEHIAGLKTIPTTTARQYLISLWSKYQQAILVNQRRH